MLGELLAFPVTQKLAVGRKGTELVFVRENWFVKFAYCSHCVGADVNLTLLAILLCPAGNQSRARLGSGIFSSSLGHRYVGKGGISGSAATN
jgi:hypothetical protein